MFSPRSLKKVSCLTAIALSSAIALPAQDASQLGFSELQAQANALVERGQLVEAMPLLKELIQRVEATDNSDIKLDFPIFLLGTAHIQQYVSTRNNAQLNEALTWYDKLENEYPDSPKVKDARLKKIDIFRALGRIDDATQLMQVMLRSPGLTYSEQVKLLKDLTQTYYGTGNFEAGMPFFRELMETSRNEEEQALAAAASFEGYIEKNQYDQAIQLLPILAKESEVRYRPRLNVALLKASDALVEAERLTDAALLLNLIKTTDLMIEFHENQVSDKKARIEQRQAFGGAEEEVQRLQQEVTNLEATLAQLRQLPTLRNELLVRRARNYTKTGRRYEAYWMFHDLMVENQNDPQIEFYTYATFSGALQLNKQDAVLEVGRVYRQKFPDGNYFSDVSAALAINLKEAGEDQEFLSIVTNFLSTRPLDPASGSLFAQWASHLIEEKRYEDLIAQASAWKQQHDTTVYSDGIEYWSGMSHLQLANYVETITSMDNLLQGYPTSNYAEDGLLRKGTALFYNQQFIEARDTLTSYIRQYPQGGAIDQAHFFLGEVENLAGNYDIALAHFQRAVELTDSTDILDSASFRIGNIYELREDYDQMTTHFIRFIQDYPESKRIAEAIVELGRAYEYTQNPVEMLRLYREAIAVYQGDAAQLGVDTLVEAYAEKYTTNLERLEETVALIDRMNTDLDFREKMVTDRGFLFEQFYLNQKLDQPLYNRLRFHPSFGPQLMAGLEPIESLTFVYREQLAAYPQQTPEAFFRDLLQKAQGQNDRVAEVRALMGLYRVGIELEPASEFDGPLLRQLSPRALLYVADYARNKNLDYAVAVWTEVLTSYPTSDAAIVSYLRLADVSEQRNDLPTALTYLGKIVELFPGSPKLPAVILQQGDLLTKMGRTDEARAKYQYILRVPDWRGVAHARALYQTGQSYMTDQEYAMAHGFFERTFLGYSHFVEWSARAYLEDAQALVQMGEPQDAITTLQEAIELLGPDAPVELMEPIQSKLEELQS